MTDQLNLVRASEIGGLPVVTIHGGEDAAEIKDVVYDASQHLLIGFTLNKRGWFRGALKGTLEVADVVGIGPDAVMVTDESSLGTSDAPASTGQATNEAVDVIGDSVVTASGTVLGEVIDVIIETGPSPIAVGYEVKTESGSVFVPSSAQMSVSGDNLMVPAEAEEFTRNDLAGFGGAVRSFRDLLARGGTS